MSELLNYIGFYGGQLRCKDPAHDNEPMWCSHIREVIKAGEDAPILHPGMTVFVPIFPENSIFAQVIIDGELVGESALMKMKHVPDFGREVEVPLGFWNPGEGMASIRLVIIDYLRSKVDPEESFLANDREAKLRTKCPTRAHGLRSQRLIEENQHDPKWRWTCLWNIVMERACTPCVQDTGNSFDNNFGIDDSVLPGRRPWNPVRGS